MRLSIINWIYSSKCLIHNNIDKGDLYTWGKNRDSCLGLGHPGDMFFPFKVSLSI